MGLTSEKSLIEINKLFDLCFEANALCDRIVYVLSIKFNMVDFSEWFHKNIAHTFTGDEWADKIEAFGELRGDLFYRGMLPEQSQDYITVSSAMETFVMKCAEIERQNIIAIKTCMANDDISYEDFLREFGVNSVAPMVKQATVLYNAIKEYEQDNNLYKFNKDYKAWVISQFKGED